MTTETPGEAMERMAVAIQEVQLTIADRFTPAIERTADAMHVFWYELLPWHRRWWHLVTGHRTAGYCLTHPWRQHD